MVYCIIEALRGWSTAKLIVWTPHYTYGSSKCNRVLSVKISFTRPPVMACKMANDLSHFFGLSRDVNCGASFFRFFFCQKYEKEKLVFVKVVWLIAIIFSIKYVNFKRKENMHNNNTENNQKLKLFKEKTSEKAPALPTFIN